MIQREDILQQLDKNNIEYRPIVAGDFTQNEVLSYFDYEIHGSLKNAKHLHNNGFFVGNHQVDITEFLAFIKSSDRRGGGGVTNPLNSYIKHSVVNDSINNKHFNPALRFARSA